MADDESPWLAVIGRSLAYLALHRQELGNASVGDKAAFLEGLGVPRKDVAEMLGTTSESVRVLLSMKKAKKGAGNGKKKGT